MSQLSATPHGSSRAPGSFSTTIATSPILPPLMNPRPALRKVESSSSEDITPAPLNITKQRVSPHRDPSQNVPAAAAQRSHALYALNTGNNNSSSLNFSRPTARDLPLRNASPLTSTSESPFHRSHGRKHSSTQGSFEPYLPTAASSNLGSHMANLNATNSAAIAAQAAMQHQSMHMRQRSQTVPTPSMEFLQSTSRKGSRGPASPPLLSLTEASGPKESGFGGQSYANGLLGGSHGSAAQTAASLVFPKSPANSPNLAPVEHASMPPPDKPLKSEKSKVKLFSRPGKIGISKDKEAKAAALPSPSKLAFTRGNHSVISLADSSSSMYSMTNSSSATIRQVETAQTMPIEKEKKEEKEKHKHHFLSRQKHKLSSKDDHHLPLSSSASNSKPVNPEAPSSLYNFNLPPSPGPANTSFAKSMSGLDLRHGGRALREKKKEEKIDALNPSELSFQSSNEWPGPSSIGSTGGASYLGASAATFGYPSSIYGNEANDLGRYGLNNMGADDVWPYLKAKLLIIFEGEDLRMPVEDFNRLVSLHLQSCIRKRAPNVVVEDLRDLLTTGFSSLDQTLRRTPDERLIPHLVEMWLFTFTTVLPYIQAVFLPLDLEFSGHGPLLTPEQARDFWGALPSHVPASSVLEVRRIVLTAYRDTVILPRFETLKTIFSRLSLDSISIPGAEILSTSPDSFSGGRPGTAMSLDPSTASYGSTTTTLLDSTGSGARSRAISNVSHGSDGAAGGAQGSFMNMTSANTVPNTMPPPPRPFTPSSTHPLLNPRRQQTVEDSSKALTETVGSMLQCVSVLSSVGVGKDGEERDQERMMELTRGLKLNWLGRGRMGRDRRGLVGARVPGGSIAGVRQRVVGVEG